MRLEFVFLVGSTTSSGVFWCACELSMILGSLSANGWGCVPVLLVWYGVSSAGACWPLGRAGSKHWVRDLSGELSPIYIMWDQKVSGGPMSWTRLSHLRSSGLTPSWSTKTLSATRLSPPSCHEVAWGPGVLSVSPLLGSRRCLRGHLLWGASRSGAVTWGLGVASEWCRTLSTRLFCSRVFGWRGPGYCFHPGLHVGIRFTTSRFSKLFSFPLFSV